MLKQKQKKFLKIDHKFKFYRARWRFTWFWHIFRFFIFLEVFHFWTRFINWESSPINFNKTRIVETGNFKRETRDSHVLASWRWMFFWRFNPFFSQKYQVKLALMSEANLDNIASGRKIRKITSKNWEKKTLTVN